MQTPSLAQAVLNHLPSGNTFYFESETLLDGRERLERKTKTDLQKLIVPSDSGTRLFWAQWMASNLQAWFYLGPNSGNNKQSSSWAARLNEGLCS